MFNAPGNIRFWCVKDRALLLSFDLPSPVSAITFSPEGNVIAYGIDNGTIVLIDNPPANRISCARAKNSSSRSRSSSTSRRMK